MSYRILIVDDDHLISRGICRFLESEEFFCLPVYSGEDALRVLKTEDFDLVLLDISLPGMDGFQTMKIIKRDYPETQIFILTASQNIHDAIKAIKLGADDYIIKSTDIEELKIAVRKAIKTYNIISENILLKKQLEKRFGPDQLTAIESPKMRQVDQLIKKVARLENTTVLIMGESGTGKEVVAREIHNLSPRSNKPFIDINCSALPSTLMESELFGYEKGAFTDAKNQKKGLLELTEKGTLFLDEISTLDLSIQSKLLRFLEQRTFRRIGGTVDHRVDLRVIAATNRDLKKKIIENEFREDLFYRLNVFPILVPPLRERKEDILSLADFFIKRFNLEFNKDIKGLQPESLPHVLHYIYPGNVRELKNIIERAMIMEETDMITLASLNFPRGKTFFPEPISNDLLSDVEKQDKESRFKTLQEIEQDHINDALLRAGGNKRQAAKLLGIGRSTLFRKIAAFDQNQDQTK